MFGYGSLMWNPGFPYRETVCARLHGYRRALCVWSWFHRGTRDTPGLVFGLDRGGSCVGRAFRVSRDERDRVVHYLCEREMVTPVYYPQLLTVRSAESRMRALTFTVDRGHAQYAGDLSVEQAAEVVRRAAGQSGPNERYVLETVNCLEEMGMHCEKLWRIRELVRGYPA